MNRSSAASASSSSAHKRRYTETGIILDRNLSRIFTDEKTIRLVFLKENGEIDSLSRPSQSAPLSHRLLRLRNDCAPSANSEGSSDFPSDDGSLQSKTAATSSQSLTDSNAIIITTGTSNRTCSNELLNVLTIDDGGDLEQRISRYRL